MRGDKRNFIRWNFTSVLKTLDDFILFVTIKITPGRTIILILRCYDGFILRFTIDDGGDIFLVIDESKFSKKLSLAGHDN